MKKLLIALSSIAFLAGCASTDQYRAYLNAQQAIANARATAEVARYQALASIAGQGDTAAKVAAVISIQAGGGANQQPIQQLAMPKTAGDISLQWASLLLPNLTQFYSINRNAAVAVTQSNNATALGIAQSNNQAAMTASTNAAFVNMGNNAVSIANNGFTSITTVANTGITNAGNHADGNINIGAGSGVSNTAEPTVVNQPAPVVVTQPAPIVVTP